MAAVLRPWLDGNIPAQRGPGVLLASGRADVEVAFIERVGEGSCRVYYPADSQNEVVVTAAEGKYAVGAICPAVLGSDGRVSMVYPPLTVEGEPIYVGDTTESIEAMQVAANAVIINHETKITQIEGGVQETKDLLAATDSVVDGLSVAVTAQGVSIEDAVQAAQSAKVAADAAVTATVVEYALSASRTVAPSEGWSTATVLPTEAKPFVWMQTKVTYGSGVSVTTSPVVTTGPAGSPGVDGEDGAGIEIAGSVATYAGLPSNLGAGDAGKGYLVEDTGLLYIWDGLAFPAVSQGVEFRGPKGDTGTKGDPGSPGTPGAPGGEGPQGVSVTAVTSYWQATTLTSAPAKPTTATPSGWGLTEPEYEAGKTLWRVEKVSYSNGQFAYSEVSKVSAYTAAGEAIHIANMSREQLEYALADTPPGTPVEGAIWFPRDEGGDITGVWRWSGAGWDTHATLTGLLLVPTADGGQTLIGPDGVDTTQLVADLLRTKVLYADVAGVETLVITDIPRKNLAADVGEALATAETLGDRIVLTGGKLTIARNRVNSVDPLTAVTLGATSLDFVVDDKAVAYIDSELEQMSIANILARDSLHVGAHQVRTLPGTQVTVWQFVGAVV